MVTGYSIRKSSTTLLLFLSYSSRVARVVVESSLSSRARVNSSREGSS